VRITIWHHIHPDYDERLIAMSYEARSWMQSADCGLSLVPLN
jgi:hypothetical protein